MYHRNTLYFYLSHFTFSLVSTETLFWNHFHCVVFSGPILILISLFPWKKKFNSNFQVVSALWNSQTQTNVKVLTIFIPGFSLFFKPLIPNHPPPRKPFSSPIPSHRSQTGLPTVEGYTTVITRRNTCYRITVIRWNKLGGMNHEVLTDSETPN